jgi:hypothetical protein
VIPKFGFGLYVLLCCLVLPKFPIFTSHFPILENYISSKLDSKKPRWTGVQMFFKQEIFVTSLVTLIITEPKLFHIYQKDRTLAQLPPPAEQH